MFWNRPGTILRHSVPRERDVISIPKLFPGSRCSSPEKLHHSQKEEGRWKRSEMRLHDRHIREMEERFCFLVTSDQEAAQIYQHGLMVENTDQQSLGNPSYGIYLHKHVDVALKNVSGTPAGKVLIIFKVLFGKVKKVPVCFGRNGTHDPTVNYDCHMSKDPIAPRDSMSQQILGSSVFLFDYNENQELKLRPRQCLPYAMVSLVPLVNPSLNSTPVPSMKLGPKTKVAYLETHMLAHRARKGQNATVIFNHFGTTDRPRPEYKPQVLGKTPAFLRGDQQDTQNISSSPDKSFDNSGHPVPPHFNSCDQNLLTPPPISRCEQLHLPLPPLSSWKPQQPSTPLNSSPPFTGSLQFLENHQLLTDSGHLQTPSHAGVAKMDHNELYYGNQVQSCQQGLSTRQDGSRQQSTFATGALEQVSSVVYASRVIKDPRLSARETINVQGLISKGIERDSQTDPLVCKLTESPENNNLNLKKQEKTHRETAFKDDPMPSQPKMPQGGPTASLVNSSVPLSVMMSTENQPSSSMLKMKFQEYSPYLHLTKEERKEKIWSLQHLSLHEKMILLDRINVYAHFFHKSKSLLSQNGKITSADQRQQCNPGSTNICLPSTGTREMCNSGQETNTGMLPQNTMNSEHSPSISNHHPSFVSGAVKESAARPLERNTDQIELEKINICRPEPATMYITETEYDGHKVPVNLQDGTAVSNDPLAPFHPEMTTTESSQDTEVRFNLNSAVEQNLQDCLNANFEASRQNSETVSQTNSVTEEKIQGTAPEIFEENRQSREQKCEPILATEGKRLHFLSSVQGTHESEPRCSVIFQNHTDIMEACEEVHDTEAPEVVICADHYPGVLSSEGCERLLQKDGERNEIDSNREEISKTSDNVQADDSVYSFLLKRLQLNEVFFPPYQNRTCSISSKHYLKPKCNDSYMDVNALTILSHKTKQLDGKQQSNIRVTIIADRDYAAVAELPSLSKRFSVSESLEGTQGSLTALDNEKLTHHRVISENSDSILKATTCDTFNKAHAHNVRLIKIMAEKYKGKENAYIRKMRDRKHVTVRKRADVKQSVTDISYSQHASHLVQSENVHVPHKKRNFKHKTFSPETVKRNIRARTLGKKYKSCSKSKSTKVISHNISLSNHSKTSKQVPIKSRKGTIMKMMKVFRRSNHWGTVSYKRMCSQVNMPRALAESIPFSPTSADNQLLRCNAFERKPLKAPSGETPSKENDQYMRDSNESINQKNHVADDDTNSPLLTTEIIHEENAKSNSGSTTSNSTEELQHSKEAQDLSNTETSQEAQSICTILQNKLLSPNCTNMPGINKVNEGETKHRKQEKYLQQENALEADTHSMKEFEESSRAMDPAKEIIPTTENMEVPLDAAIEILCGTESRSNVPKPQEEMTLVLPLMSGQSRTEKADTSDKAHYCTPQEQENKINTSSREVKLISRLRDYLTGFESTVKNSEKTTFCGTAAHLPPISETLQNNANDQKEQPVQLVVLDRVELNHLRPSGLPIPTKVCPPNHLIYNKEQPQKGKTTGNNKNDDSVTCISPDSTSMLEIPENVTLSYLDKKTTEAEVSTSVPDISHGTKNAETSAWRERKNPPKGTIYANQMTTLKALEESEPEKSEFCKTKKGKQKLTSHVVKLNTKSIHRDFTVGDISDTLKLGDKAASLVELCPIRAKCKVMLQYFISNFERKQNVEANRTIVSRDQILDQYMECPPIPIELKYEALNSFLELQIMMEAWQFVDNKMRYLSGLSTFRSMLWYDPTLYGELYKGKVGFQQQSSLYSSFQQNLINEGPIALQRYHLAVSTLNQQLQSTPQMSYYMYLKSKRERLEIEAALRNPADIESFFLSVPLSCMVNFGNTVESLEKVQKLVTTFTETPADKLEDGFDVGKAEHLAMVFRFLQEKIYYLKTCNNTMVSKMSWFGMEHILYDASKILVWRDVKQVAPHEPLAKYKKTNPQIVYGVTESGVSLFHTNVSKRTQLMVTTRTPSPKFRLANRAYRTRALGRGRLPIDKTRCSQNKNPKNVSMPVIDLTKSPYRDEPNVYHLTEPPSKNATHIQAWTHQQKPVKNHVINWGERLSQPMPPYPEIRACLRSSKGGIDPNSQINLPASLGAEASNSDGRQWILNWDLQNFQDPVGADPGPGHPLWINVRDSGHAPIIEPILSEQTQMSSWTSLSSPSLQPTSSVTGGNTALQSLCSVPPLISIKNQVPPLCEPTPINYPFFLLNGQTYSTANPELSTATLNNKEAFPLYPV
ncbi:uncharacterized protein LOC105021734 isoform X3 [Esox lucius]|uniref:Testis expressed 15, meiosis and synapsis associated n=1 Tax=Esox lucius TaxID=8010 RepID=A0A3P8YP54_ESOLU|nr:uncharacterized protein LOC105021734 isoform X3 [Esox lucius]XP_012992718.3 uncharacterized protein LOC105021734 isoform X3 [Esox lucius]